jgi:hypothetical protein
LRSNNQSGPQKRSCVKVAAIGSSHSGIDIDGHNLCHAPHEVTGS